MSGFQNRQILALIHQETLMNIHLLRPTSLPPLARRLRS